ncbi:unknown [Orgyia pseudotsugata multiple nucleopolyhedrovirus]|uniref:Uncharacterized protein n=1 Tax=Orgyia pseudotsugata multicapsid polyhedrosis virus TaxID=262177 RepID=O10292_NPVOP|nr:hypothetical protein OpmnVgp037 [Orgyia pseudotsugata multiple nucleopolyhedrovirus]AAC59036.1 unknown [Orgyia pseudotsugata multiple nucleopolyhedrovirus]
MARPVRPNDLYCKTRKTGPFMPLKQAPALQAAAFAAVLRNNLFAAAQTCFEPQVFKKLCLAWAELYSDSVHVPIPVTLTLLENDFDHVAVRVALVNYVPAPNLPFVDGFGCAQFKGGGVKFVGMLRMEHKNRRDETILQKN